MQILVFSFLIFLQFARGDERKIACLEGFRPLKLHDDNQWRVLHFNWHSGNSPNDCSPDSVSRICRKAFPDVAYGLKGESVDVHYTKVHRTSDRVRLTTKWKDGALEFQEFLCQGQLRRGSRADSSQWDKLDGQIVATRHTPCLMEAQWMEYAEDKCGEKPLEFAFGGACEEQGKYLEVVFLCDQPFHDSKLTFLTIMEEVLSGYTQKISSLLEHYISRAKTENDFQRLRRKGESACRIGRIAALEEEHDNAQFWNDETSNVFTARQTSELAAKHRLLQHGFQRAMMLFKMAANLIYDKVIDRNYLQRYDGFYAEPFINEFIENELGSNMFPQMKQILKEYWIDQICRKNTPLLRKEHAEFEERPLVDLLQMYLKIAEEGTS